MNKLQRLLTKISERLKYEKWLSLFEGVLLVVIGVVSLFFDANIGELTLLFLFPTAVILISLEVFFLADKYKELDTSRWILLLIEGFLILGLAVYFIFNPIEASDALVKWVGIIIIFKNMMKILILPTKLIGEYIIFILGILFGLLFVLFTSTVISVLYTIILILFIVCGVIKIAWSITLSKLLRIM